MSAPSSSSSPSAPLPHLSASDVTGGVIIVIVLTAVSLAKQQYNGERTAFPGSRGELTIYEANPGPGTPIACYDIRAPPTLTGVWCDRVSTASGCMLIARSRFPRMSSLLIETFLFACVMGSAWRWRRAGETMPRVLTVLVSPPLLSAIGLTELLPDR